MSKVIAHIQRMLGVSGSEKYIADLAKEQKANGAKVCVIIVCKQSDKKKLQSYTSDLVVRDIDVFWIIDEKLLTYKLLYKLNFLLKEIAPAIVHTHLLHADIYTVLVKKLFRNSFHIISTKHGYQESFLLRHGFEVKRRPIKSSFYWLSRIVEKGIDQSYTISIAMSKLYYDLKITKTEIPVIYHGVTESYLKSIERKETFKKGRNTFTIVVVGRLVSFKGHIYLFEAFSKVLQKSADLLLYVIGDGELRNDLEGIAYNLGISQNVVFAGFQPNPQNYVSKADLIVVPSLIEPFGLVFLEAFAHRKPVVAFDIPAGNEIVQNEKSGLLVPLKDTTRLSEVIFYLMNNPDRLSEMGNYAYETLLKRFTFSRVFTEVENLYNKIIKQ